MALDFGTQCWHTIFGIQFLSTILALDFYFGGRFWALNFGTILAFDFGSILAINFGRQFWRLIFILVVGFGAQFWLSILAVDFSI